MKIDALRVAAFRRFADPAAIENFSNGVNVLAGPNEMGKSTFFHALEAAFIVRHKVSGTVLDSMRPFSGGDPLVEADFSHEGVRWRIRKQFGRASSAILTDLRAGRIVARNAEAEEQLGRLTGRASDMPGPLGLVWVRQQRTLQAPDPDVDPLSGKERPRGERTALQDAISHEIELAAGGDVFEQVQQLTSQSLDVNLTPTRNAPRKGGPLDLARRRRDETRASLELAVGAAAAAESRLAAIATKSEELSALTASAHDGARESELARLEAELALEVRRRTDFDLAREALAACDAEARGARQAIEAGRSRAEKLASLRALHAEAETLEARIATLSQELNANAATPARLSELSSLQNICDVAEAELRAEAPRVDITLLPGGAGRVRLDGEQLNATTHRDVPEHLDIAIDGIADIRIASAGASRARAAKLRRDVAVQQMTEILTEIGSVSIEDARARAEARSQQTIELERARAKLSGAAPQGAMAVGAEIEKLSAADSGPADAESLETELRKRDAAVLLARERFDALKLAVLSDDAFRALSVALDTARTTDLARKQNTARLNLDIEKLKSEQAGADEDGRAGQVATLTGELERHDAEVKRLECDGLALLLLARTLGTIEAKARDAYFEPVTRRLKPYLQDVFGAADLGFKDVFAIDGLTRAGQREDFAVLSDGTREQLSVLVRLGFAELLAARGSAVPLVLDDPLVYSDDERLAKICRVLELASRQVQVIVLTCRATAFQPLNGHRLTVSAWQHET